MFKKKLENKFSIFKKNHIFLTSDSFDSLSELSSFWLASNALSATQI